VAALGVLVMPGDLQTGLAILAVTYYVRAFGLGAGYHRYFAHRSFKTSRPMQVVLALLGLTALQRGPLWWGETHRRHHRDVDTPDDIHSPHHQGFWYAHVGWAFDPRYAETQLDGIPDLAKYPELVWLDAPLVSRVVAIIYGGGLLAVFGLHGFVWGFCLSTVCLWHTVHWIQSLSHSVGGYRRFDTPDRSRNHLGLGLISLGEFHNNHHHRAGSARQGYAWWEVDVVFWLLRALGVLGLVWDVKDTVHDPPRVYAARRAPAVAGDRPTLGTAA
jgi:stearoyl-CoA desaturase (delta-9 desaturase)